MAITLTETEARRLFRQCMWVSLVPILGIALALVMVTVETSLPGEAIKPIAILALIMIFGGELWFCRDLGRLASGLGQSGSRWRNGVWIASKFLAFIAYWLALLKMSRVVNRAYASAPVPFFPR